MNTNMSFEEVKETFLAEAPRLLARVMTNGVGCALVHFATIENIRKWHDESNGYYRGCSPAFVAKTEMMKEIRRVVASWDVRSVGDLVALVPYAFPAWVAQGRYGIELGDSGWVLRKAA